MSNYDYAFEIATSRVRFGAGATREVGADLADLGARRVMVLIDPVVNQLSPRDVLVESLRREKLDFEVFDRIAVEPTEASFREAVAFATEGQFDAFVALGGGSTIDTAKVANLYTTWPADFLTYVNAPLGQGKPVPGPLRPLIAIPTTAGTGSETTGVAICDLKEQRVKSGIAHRYLKPTLGILDPDNTRTCPPMVAASAGLDVLCHAIESYTALPYDRRPLPGRPSQRPNYQGCNPISDVWAEKSLTMVMEYLPRVIADAADEEARAQMLLAASYAGIGFGNAGVHLCHAMAYPIASLVRDYHAPQYPSDHPMVPHGISVVVTAPAVFRFTSSADPRRHLRAAELLGADVRDAGPSDAGEVLSRTLVEILRRFEMPERLSALGYGDRDIPALVAGTVPQERLTKLSPRPVGAAEIEQLLRETL